MENLPMDVIKLIMEYYGKMKLRNGKYMKPINNNDPRYEIFDRALIFKVDKWYINREMRVNSIPSYIKMIAVNPKTMESVSVHPFFSLNPMN